MVLLSDLNAQRAKQGASQVVVPGMSPSPGTQPISTNTPVSARPAAGTTTYDPNTRTISGPGADAAAMQSGLNRGDSPNIYVAPTSNRAADQRVAIQDEQHRQTLNKPSEVTSFNTTAAKLMQTYDSNALNTYVTQGKLTQDQADQIQKAGGLSPDLALKLGLGKTETVAGQLGLQQLTKKNLEERLREANSDLTAGIIDQIEYDKIKGEVSGGLGDADRLIGELQNPYTAKTASGANQDRLTQINDRLNAMTGEHVPTVSEGWSVQDIEAFKRRQQMEKDNLLREREQLQGRSIGGGANNQSYGNNGTQSDDPQSRAIAVQDLLRQGVNNPRKILNALNYAEDGTKIGDFTLDEVKGLMKMSPAGTRTGVSTSTKTMIESIISGMPPEQSKFLEGALSALDARMAQSQEDFFDDKALADFEFSKFQEIANDMMTRSDSVQSLTAGLARKQKADDEAAAAATKQAELTRNETERQMTAVKLNEQRRQIELSNAKKINSMTNRLAIAGGFGSMGGINEIEDAQSDGDQAVARFVNDIALTDQAYLDRALQIDANYTGAISKIHRDYSDSMLNIVTKYNDRVDEVQSLMFGSLQKRNEAVKTARNRARDASNDLQDKTISMIDGARKEVLQRQSDLEKQMRQDQKDKWDDTMQYIDRYGTQDKAFLAQREKELGLTPGSLQQKTLEELRMMKKTGGGSGTSLGQSTDWLQNTVNELAKKFPNDSPNEILLKAGYIADQKFGGTSTANRNMRTGVFELIGDEIGDIVTSSSVRKDIDSINISSDVRTAILSADNPEEAMENAYDSLVKDKKSPFKGDPDGASEFIVKLFEGKDVMNRARPDVDPVGDFQHVGWANPTRVLPYFTNANFTFDNASK